MVKLYKPNLEKFAQLATKARKECDEFSNKMTKSMQISDEVLDKRFDV